MSTAAERDDDAQLAAQFAELTARYADMRRQINDPSCIELDVEFVGTSLYQLGLRDLMVDDLGRFWAVSTSPIKMVFDPHAMTRLAPPGEWVEYPATHDRHEGLVAALGGDDTQAAQGFPAKEG